MADFFVAGIVFEFWCQGDGKRVGLVSYENIWFGWNEQARVRG